MRYAIGFKVQNRDKSIDDGIYVFGKYGLAFILTPEKFESEKDYRIPILNSLEDANEYLKYLREIYAYEFNERQMVHNLKKENFRIYLIKFDSLKTKGIKLNKDKVKIEKKDSYTVNYYTVD